VQQTVFRVVGKKRPVEKVNWYDAAEFCSKLSKLTGKEYRLPSEAEWEYACRAGNTTPFHFGKTVTTDLANYNGNYIYGNSSNGIYRKETMRVGSFPANPYGLHDMHGNVWEWCLDDWHCNYKEAPIDGSAWCRYNCSPEQKTGEASLRGGSWLNNPKNCRCAYREYDIRAEHHSINMFIGFRVVCAFGRDS
ncbi:MAG: formylglycine-generating enzyme family protein, partial [Cyanobacteria bacterium J06639_18]